MPKPFVLPAVRRKRGNPNWGQPHQIPMIVTEFEMQVKKLGLTKDTCAVSSELRIWCEGNSNRCYIPEWLLGIWGIPVDSIFTG
jgi:hypothetical protein